MRTICVNSTGRVIGEVLIPGQVSRSHENNCHSVAENHLCRCESDRREIEGAQFPLERQMHVHIADSSESIALEVRETRYTPLVRTQGMRRRSSSVLSHLLNKMTTSRGERMPMLSWSTSRGERKDERMPREMRVWDLVGDKARFSDTKEENGSGGGEEGASEEDGFDQNQSLVKKIITVWE